MAESLYNQNVKTVDEAYNKKVSPTDPKAGVWTMADLYRRKTTTAPPVQQAVTIADPTMPFWLKAGLPNTTFQTSTIAQALALALALDKTKI